MPIEYERGKSNPIYRLLNLAATYRRGLYTAFERYKICDLDGDAGTAIEQLRDPGAMVFFERDDRCSRPVHAGAGTVGRLDRLRRVTVVGVLEELRLIRSFGDGHHELQFVVRGADVGSGDSRYASHRMLVYDDLALMLHEQGRCGESIEVSGVHSAGPWSTHSDAIGGTYHEISPVILVGDIQF